MDEQLNTRDFIFSYLDEYSSNVKSQINSGHTTNTLLKSYIFETNTLGKKIDVKHLFLNKDREHITTDIDEELFVLSRGKETIGYIEKLNERFSVMYSVDKAQKSDAYTNHLVKQIPLLDSLWISGKMFDFFWEGIQEVHSPQRYIKMKFEFDGFFDNFVLTTNSNIDSNYNPSKEDELFDEQKVTAITLVEEISDLSSKINGVRSFFPAFYAVGLLRFPSLVGKGGHDFYRNGKVTNRSDSFKDHRYQIKKTVEDYKIITESLEKEIWLNFDVYKTPTTEGVTVEGSPVVFKFSTSLKQHVFENFINYTFPTGKEPFRILGKPIWVNTNKVHIYGTDTHLWQRILLELTKDQFTTILPKGTCGNTIHRMVTNIQRFLDPAVKVFIGDQPYDEFIKGSFKGSGRQ